MHTEMGNLKLILVTAITLVLLDGCWCHGCWDLERASLLQLKPFFNHLKWPMKGEESSDCCQWAMVECNASTGRVNKLFLDKNFEWEPRGWYLNASYFLPFEELRSLSLANNGIRGCIENEGFDVLSSKLSDLEVLDLSNNKFDSSIISSLSDISSLKSLYLNENEMTTPAHKNEPNRIGDTTTLVKLKILRLDSLNYNGGGSVVVHSLEGFSSLKTLYLGSNNLSETTIHQALGNLSTLEELFLDHSILHQDSLWQGLCQLKNLQKLDLSDILLEGTLPQCLTNLSSLRYLDISHNQLTGNLASTSISNILSIESLSLGYNNFQLPISLHSFANRSNLKSLQCEECDLIVDTVRQTWTPKFQLQNLEVSSATPKKDKLANLPNFLYYQYDLRSIDLSGNNFGGVFPLWLFENNTRLEEILMSDNSFVGFFPCPSHPNPNLSVMGISRNQLQGQIPTNISSIFPNLGTLYLSENSFQGNILPSLRDMESLEHLDISKNNFSGVIPEQFVSPWSSLTYVKLSNNKFCGHVHRTSFNSSVLRYLWLDNNKLEGKIPDFSSVNSLDLLDISHNSFSSGRIPRWISKLSDLQVIVLSDNHLEGPVPQELCKMKSLIFLDLSKNNLSGNIPLCFIQLTNLHFVHLYENKLSGPLPSAFMNFTVMETLDLRDNDFSGTIPNWIGNLSNLGALLLKENHFHGEIPVELCQLTHLSFLDLSFNNISGRLHPCLGNLAFENRDGFPTISYQPEVIEFVTKNIFLRYTSSYSLTEMHGIDLSSNQFYGEIPNQFGNLSMVRSLNLSHNNLTGLIPETFSNLKSIESLDLSYNHLNGRIPPQLTELKSLEIFTVAQNNLSGPVPDRKSQFGTFDENSYEGNPHLCGPPLNNSCNEDSELPIPNEFSGEGGDDSFMDMFDFYISFAVSYIMVLLGITTVLYINSYWRQVWFYWTELWITRTYYF